MALLLTPGIGTILLILGVILLAVLLGLFAVVYLTLQAYHLMTAVTFLVCTLFMFYVSVKTRIITDRTMKKYPWIAFLIPGSFVLGYLTEMTENITLTVSSLSTATPVQGSVNAAALLLLILGILYVFSEWVS